MYRCEPFNSKVCIYGYLSSVLHRYDNRQITAVL